VLPEVEVFLGEVPIAVYETPGGQSFADTVIPFAKDANTILLANHGTITFGPDLENAYFNTEIIDALKRPEGAKTIANIFQPLSAGARVRTAVEDMQFKANAAKLADILTSEKGLELLASYGAEGRNIAGRALSNFILSQSASTTTTIKKPLVVDVFPQPGLLGQ
jgi:hypothetical protein